MQLLVSDFNAVSFVKRRVFNSSGGLWLQRNMVPGCTYQLDPFHRSKVVRFYLNDSKLRKMLDLLHKHKSKKAISAAEASIESALTPQNRKTAGNCFLISATTAMP